MFRVEEEYLDDNLSSYWEFFLTKKAKMTVREEAKLRPDLDSVGPVTPIRLPKSVNFGFYYFWDRVVPFWEIGMWNGSLRPSTVIRFEMNNVV